MMFVNVFDVIIAPNLLGAWSDSSRGVLSVCVWDGTHSGSGSIERI